MGTIELLKNFRLKPTFPFSSTPWDAVNPLSTKSPTLVVVSFNDRFDIVMSNLMCKDLSKQLLTIWGGSYMKEHGSFRMLG